MKPLFIIGFVVLFILWIKKGTKNLIDITYYLMGWTLILVFQNFFHVYWAFNTASFMIIKLLIGIFIFSIIGVRFREIYFDIIFFLCLTSLILFSINNLGIKFIPLYSYVDRNSIFIYTQLLNKETGEIIPRNSGMFWEPGAFQGYINMVFLLYLPYLRNLWTKQRFKILIIITTLATTYSTTGYLVFTFILLTYLLFFQKTYIVKSAIYFITAFIAMYYIFINVPFLASKLGIGQENAETNIGGDRILNLTESIPLIAKSPFLGYGYSQDSLALVEKGFSNGWAAYIFFMGFLGFLLYYIFLIFRLNKQKIKTPWLIIFLVVDSLLMQGEGFLTHPFFLALPFLAIAPNLENKFM